VHSNLSSLLVLLYSGWSVNTLK